MEPQHVLIDSVQAGKHLFENPDHPDEGSEVCHVPASVITGERGAVPEPVVEDRLVRAGRPEPEIGQPQRLYRSHRVSEHDQRIELQILENRRGLSVHISEALCQQLLLALKVPVDRA